MAQEFTIKSQEIEDKINQLLPSQGGFQPGVDFSASTMVIPIVDLTETAEGSSLRQDLQSSLSLTTATAYSVSNTTSTLVNTTGYYRVFGQLCLETTAQSTADISVTDGLTTKKLINFLVSNSQENVLSYDFLVKLEAGDSLTATTGNALYTLTGVTRQIADLQGNLTNP